MSTTPKLTDRPLENGYFVNSDGLLVLAFVNRHPYRLSPQLKLPGLKRGSYTREQIEPLLLSGNDTGPGDPNA